MDEQRFLQRLGELPLDLMDEIALAVAAVVECPPVA